MDRASWRRVVLLLAAGVIALACGGVLDPNEQVDPEAAQVVARSLEGGAFPSELASDPMMAPTMRYLAARHADPRVVAAALDVLASSDPSPRLVEIVLERLDHPDAIVVAAALRLAGRQLVRGDAPALAAAVRDLVASHSESGGRHLALVTLCRDPDWSDDPRSVQVVLGAASDTAPEVLTEALNRLGWAAEDLEERSAVARVAVQRFDHPLPGVRGRAVVLAARAVPSDGWMRAAVRTLLDDPHPFVQASAALVLAEIGDPEVLPDLLALAERHERATWTLDGWTQLDGRPGTLLHTASRYGRTDDAAVEGLALLTAPLGEDAFVRPEVDPEHIDDSLRVGAAGAAEWYRSHADAVAVLEAP